MDGRHRVPVEHVKKIKDKFNLNESCGFQLNGGIEILNYASRVAMKDLIASMPCKATPQKGVLSK